MTAYQPPFAFNHAMVSKVAEIGEWLGRWKQANPGGLAVQLRRGNRIRSIQASLAIEANTLSIEQVTAVLDGKPVLAPHAISRKCVTRSRPSRPSNHH